jgi:predicted DCC family thiol-disulfide oxidoreductase YuxK
MLCSKEIQHYQRKDKQGALGFIDIKSPDFDAKIYGLCEEAVNLHMHAIDKNGQVFIGVDAFIAIWKRIPSYRYLVPIFENKVLRLVLDPGYDVFARFIRPRLPKYKCQTGACEFNEN